MLSNGLVVSDKKK